MSGEISIGDLQIGVPSEVIVQAVQAAITKHLQENHSFQDWMERTVKEEIALVAPMHPNMQAVIDSVRTHLERYPLIGNDPAFQDFVGQKIFEWLQAPARRTTVVQ